MEEVEHKAAALKRVNMILGDDDKAHQLTSMMLKKCKADNQPIGSPTVIKCLSVSLRSNDRCIHVGK